MRIFFDRPALAEEGTEDTEVTIPSGQHIIRVSRHSIRTMETFVVRHLHRAQSSMCSQVCKRCNINKEVHVSIGGTILRAHSPEFLFFYFIFASRTVASSLSIDFSCMFNLISLVAALVVPLVET